jgi:predicted RNase H-like HicB family nuclease
MPTNTYTLVIEPEPTGGYSVNCLELPACSCGATREEARAVRELLDGRELLETLRETRVIAPGEERAALSTNVDNLITARRA